MRWTWLAALAALGGLACKGNDAKHAPAPVPVPTAEAAPIAPPPAPKPPPLPAGSCCCQTELRGDQLVEVTADARCSAELHGCCVDAARCWLPPLPAPR
jgi:hypothetical protein